MSPRISDTYLGALDTRTSTAEPAAMADTDEDKIENALIFICPKTIEDTK